MSLKQRLLSQSAVIFAARILGAGIIFLAQAALARMWGAEILGEYLLIIATVNLVAVVMPLGFHTIGSYFAAEYSAKNDQAMLWQFLLWCYGHIVVVGVLVTALCVPVAYMFGASGQAIASYAVPASILAIATAFIFANTALLVGLRRPIAGFFSELLFRPLLVVGSFAIAATVFDGEGKLHAMIWMLALSYLAVSLMQFGLAIARIQTIPAKIERRKPELQRWWRFALPWAMISLATEFFFEIDLLLLSSHLGRDELAIFGVCTRIFSLISFGVAAVYAVTIPDMFEAEAKNDREGFHRKIGEANLVASGIALVLVLGVFLGGRFVLAIFGTEFLVGAWPLVILSLGLLVRSVFGPASMVLSIHDRPYASLPAVGCGVISLIAFNYLLVPAYGLLGAAIAALAAIVIWSSGLWLTAWFAVGVDVSIVARLRVIHRARG